jgi:hypothetical protein
MNTTNTLTALTTKRITAGLYVVTTSSGEFEIERFPDGAWMLFERMTNGKREFWADYCTLAEAKETAAMFARLRAEKPDALPPVEVEFDLSTQWATARRAGKPVATIQRKRVYEKGPLWKAFDLKGRMLFEQRTSCTPDQMAKRIEYALSAKPEPVVSDNGYVLGYVDGDEDVRQGDDLGKGYTVSSGHAPMYDGDTGCVIVSRSNFLIDLPVDMFGLVWRKPAPQPIKKDGWTMRDKDGEVIHHGAQVSLSGDRYSVTGGMPPRHSNSSGRIYVSRDGHETEYFPHVFDMRWTRDGAE